MSFGCFLGGFRTTLGALWATGESLWGALGLIGVTLGALGVTLGSFGMPLRHLGSLFGHFLSRVEDFKNKKNALPVPMLRQVSREAVNTAQACVLETCRGKGGFLDALTLSLITI